MFNSIILLVVIHISVVQSYDWFGSGGKFSKRKGDASGQVSPLGMGQFFEYVGKNKYVIMVGLGKLVHKGSLQDNTALVRRRRT